MVDLSGINSLKTNGRSLTNCGGFKVFLFSPLQKGKDSHFDECIFQMGWFDHQLAKNHGIWEEIHLWGFGVAKRLKHQPFFASKNHSSFLRNMTSTQEKVVPLPNEMGQR